MKNIAILFLSALTLFSCNAQTDKKTEDNQNEVAKRDIKPKVDYKVNKEYDENGNLIRLDSTYTYYYSNIDKDAMMADSIFKKFTKRFSVQSPFMNDDLLNDFFDQENFIEDDFFSEDFFRGNFKRNQEMMQKMMSRMDSLKNQFFIEEYPLKKEEEEKDKN